jgi:DNA gyrase/topoisomerase IV, subunit A
MSLWMRCFKLCRALATGGLQFVRTSCQPAYRSICRYLPILPVVLINGAEGIGTGWSTSIPNYNPTDVVAGLRAFLAGAEPPELKPWYRGFVGEIDELPAPRGAAGQSYLVIGVVRQVRHSRASSPHAVATGAPPR